MTQTLEAYADTLIPGQKRFPTDVAIAGVVSGAGAVQGGAIEMLKFAPVGLEPALPGLALLINLYAVAYAISQKIVLHLAVPPFVELDFPSRTALLSQDARPGRAKPVRVLWARCRLFHRVPHGRFPSNGGRNPATAIPVWRRSAFRLPIPTECGASRSSHTGASSRRRIRDSQCDNPA